MGEYQACNADASEQGRTYQRVLCIRTVVLAPVNTPPSGPLLQPTVQFISTKSFALNSFDGYWSGKLSIDSFW